MIDLDYLMKLDPLEEEDKSEIRAVLGNKVLLRFLGGELRAAEEMNKLTVNQDYLLKDSRHALIQLGRVRGIISVTESLLDNLKEDENGN